MVTNQSHRHAYTFFHVDSISVLQNRLVYVNYSCAETICVGITDIFFVVMIILILIEILKPKHEARTKYDGKNNTSANQNMM